MKILVLFMSLLSLQAFATDFSQSYRNLFLSQDQEIVRGTETAIKIARKTGRNVVMVFPEKTVTAANGEKSAATVTITGLSFEGLVGAEAVPSLDDEGNDVTDGLFLFTERLAVRLFNNRAAVYGGADWNVDKFDNVRLGGRLNIASEDSFDGGYDVYAYYEANVGKPKDKTKNDMTAATGLGFLTTGRGGHGFLIESGIAFYDRPVQGDSKRGFRIAAGYVKQWGNKTRMD